MIIKFNVVLNDKTNQFLFKIEKINFPTKKYKTSYLIEQSIRQSTLESGEAVAELLTVVVLHAIYHIYVMFGQLPLFLL